MNTFLLSINATSMFSGDNPPTLEILVDGIVVFDLDMELGVFDYNIFVDFSGNVPSSLDFRFSGSSGDPGDSISFSNVAINNTPLNVATDLTSTLLMQAESTSVTAPDDVFLHEPPTLAPPDITGTSGDDQYIQGTNLTDSIDGLAGNDWINGRDGDDDVNGGEGADYIFGQDGNDNILGGGGDDVIYGNAGDDNLFGEADNDILIGGEGSDLINGGTGSDGLVGDAGDDILFGGDGDDWLIGDAGDDMVFGEGGDDYIVGGDDNDILSGGTGDDQLYAGDGDDLVSGGDGDDEIITEGGNDEVVGGDGDDTIYGGDGIDDIHGDDGDDIIFGEDGNDTLEGDDGDDVIDGGAGADTINGGEGNDTLRGHGLDATEISNLLFSNPNLVYSEVTGSFYEYVNTGTAWNVANASANAATLNGMNGHLATITSVEENTFIESLMDSGSSIWTSGSGEGSGANWTWSDGVEAGAQFSKGSTSVLNIYQNWLAGEPNDGSGNTVYARLREGTSDWTDRPDSDTHDYVIEWESGLISDDNAADILNGGAGNDWLYGYGGNDVLDGGEGNDVVFGGAGNDTINGDSAVLTTVLEAGRVSVTQANSTEWHTVTFTDNIENAVVKVFAEDLTGDPFTTRVRNITSTGFEFQLDEYDFQDGSTGLENLSWIAVASGTHTLSNGLEIQSGFVTTSNESTTNVSFNSSLSNAVVFSQVSSDNDLSAVVTRNDNVTSSGFDVQMQEEESADGSHTAESIGWIAIESGGSVASGILAGTTGDNVTHTNTTVNFGGTFSSTPTFIADMQSLDGGDTAVTAGSSLTTSQAQVFIDEETSGDSETNHTTENVGYIVLDEGTYEAVTNVSGSDSLFGGDGDDDIYADVVEDGVVAAANETNPLARLVLNDGAAGYWNLNETTGTTAGNLGGVGASINGTINGGATLGAAALYEGGSAAIDFDGTNDGILIPDNAAINTGTYTEKTVELVFNADDVTTRQVLYEEGGTTHGFSIYLLNGDVYVTGEHDGQWADANINAPVSTGTTYHIAFVFDQPNNSFEGFLDGVSMGSVTVNNAVFPAHSGDIGIGYAPDGLQFHDGESGSGGFNFDGRISDVAVYTTALSQTDLQARADIVTGSVPAAGAIDDMLYGGDGFDELFAGVGRDVFVFETTSAFNDVDHINGFDVGEQDAIDISDILDGFVAGTSDINDFVSLTVSGGNTIVSVDANGLTGGSSFSDIAQINNFADTQLDAAVLLANHSLIVV